MSSFFCTAGAVLAFFPACYLFGLLAGLGFHRGTEWYFRPRRTPKSEK